MCFCRSSNSTESLEKECTYNDNPGYVIFSAMGSFFIPMVVMLYVYARISCVVAQRHDQLASIDRQTRVSIYGNRQSLLRYSLVEYNTITSRSVFCVKKNLVLPVRLISF